MNDTKDIGRIDSLMLHKESANQKAINMLTGEDFLDIKEEAERTGKMSWQYHYFLFKALFENCDNNAHAHALEALFDSTKPEYNLIYLKILLDIKLIMFERLNMNDKINETTEEISELRRQQEKAVQSAEVLRQSQQAC